MKFDWHLSVLATLVTAIASFSILSAVFQKWPNAGAVMLGNTGLLTFAAALGTLIFLGINVRTALRTLDNSQKTLNLSIRSQVTSNFQKAADLLSKDSNSARTAGISLMLQTVSDQATLGHPAARTLAHFITEASESAWDKAMLLGLASIPAPTKEFPNSNGTVAYALRSLDGLLQQDQSIFGESTHMTVNGMYFGMGDYYGLKLHRLWFRSALFHRTILQGGTLDHVRMSGFVVGSLVFNRTIISDFDLKLGSLADMDSPKGFTPEDGRVFFVDCTVSDESSIVNNLPIKDWIARQRMPV